MNSQEELTELEETSSNASSQRRLEKAHLSDDAFAMAEELTRLETLLRRIQLKSEFLITNVDLDATMEIDQATFIDFCGTPLSDDDIAGLRWLPQLSYLDLSMTRITDTSVDTLRGLKNLQQLDLRGTRISVPTARALRLALPHCWLTF